MEPVQRGQRLQTVCLLILSTIAFALVWLRPVMIPFVLACVFAIGLSPLIDLLAWYLRLSRLLAVLATLVIGVVLLSVMGAVISMSIRQLAMHARKYQTQIQDLLPQATAFLTHVGISADTVSSALVQTPLQTIREVLVGTTNAMFTILSQGLLMLVFVVFLLLGGTTRGPSIGGRLRGS